MNPVRMEMLAALTVAGVSPLHGAAAEGGGLAERVARVFSPEMRRVEARLGEVAGQLAGLPELLPGPFASRFGYRSQTLLDQELPQWIQIDLGRSQPIDRIVAVPTHIPGIGAHGEGYGFPLRFKIQVADDPGMEGAVTVVDRTTEDVANPGRFPMVFRIKPLEARHVRFTSTRHFPAEEGFFWALEELAVLFGNRSLAVSLETTASSSLDLFPNWSRVRINDGMSALGMPVTSEESPTHGFQSAVTSDPKEEKWLMVDLGQEYPIEEIRLLPVEPVNFEVLGVRSFPRAWTLELAKDPDFKEVAFREQRPQDDLVGHPGGCAIVLTNLGHRGRYLRLSTQALWGINDQCGFALAELQAYSGGENVALGKPVTTKDGAEHPESAGWAPGFVTDGFTSRHRLIEYPEYLDLIERRGQLVREQGLLRVQRDRKVRAAGLALGYGGSTLGTAALLGLGWMLVRRKAVQRQAVAKLRDQIARDLHDDIGSNLGGIVLLSERWGRQCGEGEAHKGFRAIKEATEETSAAMQDIVWLIQRGNVSLRDLVARMRQSAQMILGDIGLSVAVDPAQFRDRRLSLFFRRHVFYSFKETLNNIRRHAGATTVDVRITVDSRHLCFDVRDDGVGFDCSMPTRPGHGMHNLQQRAQRLKGTCRVESSPGSGSRVTFKAPFQT
jgi:signal transduction histidine kinase